MIIFSSDKLEQAIAFNRFDPWQKTKYVILYFIIGIFTGVAPSFTHFFRPTFGTAEPPMTSSISTVTTILIAIITYIGIKKCYLVNKTADDHDFVSRLFMLYFPAGLKISAIILFFIFVIPVIASFAGARLSALFPRTAQHAPEFKNMLIYFLYIAAPLVSWLFFFILYRSFKRLAGLIIKINNTHNDGCGQSPENAVLADSGIMH